MKGRMTVVGGTAWSSHKQNNNEISPENLQVSPSIKKFLGSIQKVFFLQKKRWVTKTVNKTEQEGSGSFAFVFVLFAKNNNKKIRDCFRN